METNLTAKLERALREQSDTGLVHHGGLIVASHDVLPRAVEHAVGARLLAPDTTTAQGDLKCKFLGITLNLFF